MLYINIKLVSLRNVFSFLLLLNFAFSYLAADGEVKQAEAPLLFSGLPRREKKPAILLCGSQFFCIVLGPELRGPAYRTYHKQEMGGCCCRSARRTDSHGPPVYYCCQEDFEESEPLSSAHDPPSAIPVLPADPVSDTSIPDSCQEPNALPPPREDFVLHLIIDGEQAFEGSDNCDSLKDTEHKNVSDFVSNSPKVKEKLSNLEDSIILATDEEDVCPTCLEEYDAENPRIITKCKHHFHLSCILEWFERSNTCAICDKIMEVDNMALFDQTL